MRLLITGGAGFIGSNYVRSILSGNLTGVSSIKVLDSLTYAGNKSNLKDFFAQFEFVEGDICDESKVLDSLKGVDAVINFAAESHVDSSIRDSKKFVETNVLGVQNLLNQALKSGITKFIQISTDEVYGSISEGSWDEYSQIAPNSPYAASKAAGDLLVSAFNTTYGLDTCITRCCNNYGPYQYPEKIIPLFITNLLNGFEIPIYGDGGNIREWIHVDDHCKAIHKVLFEGKSGETYNIGSGFELSNLELAHKIIACMGFTSEKMAFVKDRLGHDFRYSLDSTKFKDEFGQSLKVEFQKGLEDTISWYQSNIEWLRGTARK
jgi:dTDP-glucose 4,6-dehydratase